jgi:hypothetical protein
LSPAQSEEVHAAASAESDPARDQAREARKAEARKAKAGALKA